MSSPTFRLDLDEYGVILVEESEPTMPHAPESGFEQAGLGGVVEKTGQQVVLKATDTIQRSLMGLANVFVGSLPAFEIASTYQLQTFTVEFQIGLAAEAGASTGVICKVMPSGLFKCTYTWDRKPNPGGLHPSTGD